METKSSWIRVVTNNSSDMLIPIINDEEGIEKLLGIADAIKDNVPAILIWSYDLPHIIIFKDILYIGIVPGEK